MPSEAYNGLGLRVGKTDSTGTYSYVCDGASPGSPVLSDGHAVYTPGLSENRGGTSSYYASDRLGNLWTMDGTTKNQLTYEDFSGFGGVVSGGSAGSPVGFGGGNGCLTDADTGLVLMGHRYYDTRTGRFISQDPAGSGDNWYGYADNDPMDETDPLGLDATVGEDGFTDPNGYHEVPGSEWGTPLHGGARYEPNTSSSTDPTSGSGGMLDGVGGALSVGLAAVASVGINYGLYNGGAARHDPSFGTSVALANIGETLASFATGGGEVKTVEEAATSCFTKGTPVQTQGKPQNIQDIRVGELVATRNLQTNQTEYRHVTRTFQHTAHDTIMVEFADAKTGKVVDTLTATPEHPFYVSGRGMTALGSLGIGTLVVTRAGPPVVVHSLVRHTSAAGVAVYNIEVEGDHTYFVGTAGGGEWVHNDCWSIARAFAKKGGEVWKLTPKFGRFIDRAVEPVSGTIDGEFGGIEKWSEHAVHVQDGMVRDPMMTGHNEQIPIEQWQKFWNHFDDHDFVPSR